MLSNRVILETLEQVVVLPTPSWNDTEQLQNELQLKRSMIGGFYTYIKESNLHKLSYDFELGIEKCTELHSFLFDREQELIKLTNWKGEIWFVNLMNNPFSSVSKSRYFNAGEKFDVKLEFEGIKVGG